MACTFEGSSYEIIKPPATPDNSLSPKLGYFDNLKFQVDFNGSCLPTHRVLAPNKIAKVL